MKKIAIALLIICFYTVAKAQKYVPQFKAGSVITYTAHVRNLGQDVPLTLNLTSITDPVTMQWSIPGFGSGTYLISAKGMQSGTRMALREPDMGATTQLKDDETLAVISKDSFNSLLTNKTFDLNKQTFTVATDTETYSINDKALDLIYATTANGKTKLWIINNPAFPIIYKMTGGPFGIDLTLSALKE
jgi:hypothetical protein